ncbi:MAG: cold shock domain-containing protein [Aliarcobacter sp.]|nr:cold shock domain-containing protein [Aliarcobacter sp.]
MEKLPILRLNTYKTEEQINEIKNKISKVIPQPIEPVKTKEKSSKPVKLIKPKEKSSKVIIPKPVNEKIIEKPIKKTGIVSWYKKDKGYGFIKPDDNSKEVFLHFKELKKINLDNIESEIKISFITKEENNKIQACNIKVLEIPTNKIENIRNIAIRVLNVLSEKYPKTFPYKPLAIGIKEDLLNISEKLGISKNELKIFLNFYCRSKKYRANLIFNTERINLKGEVVGLVKKEEATYHLK